MAMANSPFAYRLSKNLNFVPGFPCHVWFPASVCNHQTNYQPTINKYIFTSISKVLSPVIINFTYPPISPVLFMFHLPLKDQGSSSPGRATPGAGLPGLPALPTPVARRSAAHRPRDPRSNRPRDARRRPGRSAGRSGPPWKMAGPGIELLSPDGIFFGETGDRTLKKWQSKPSKSRIF